MNLPDIDHLRSSQSLSEELVDELTALFSILEQDIKFRNEENVLAGLEIKICDAPETLLVVEFAERYPIEPVTYELRMPTLRDGGIRERIEAELDAFMELKKGETVVFGLVEIIRNIVDREEMECEEATDDASSERQPVVINQKRLEFITGNVISDRKSMFQAHVARISSLEDVNHGVNQLKENRKIAKATHNIVAYRLVSGSKLYEGSDDDGENHAGGRLLNFLKLADGGKGVENVLVVVTRWYGGVKLGEVRFKHIVDAAKNCLIDCAWISSGAMR